MEQLLHFSHGHLLNLMHLRQPKHDSEESSSEEDEHEDKEDFVAEEHHYGLCNMCEEQIYSFHLCYYHCKDCNYSLHKFCAEMPTLLQNHPLHPTHSLTLAKGFQDSNPSYGYGYEWMCGVCNFKRKNFFNYHCSICDFNMDIICATMSEQKMDHPSHPHQLKRNFKKSVSRCNACGEDHQGTFYHCNTCYWFSIHLDCALLPAKLLIQQPTNDTFTHSHPLTLAYSFPKNDRKSKFYPYCRVCEAGFYIYFWLYKCDKCRYYVHLNCATSKTEPFMSILHSGRGKTSKNFKDDEHPNLLRCPFPDESYTLIKHQVFNKKELVVKEINVEMLNHFSHEHPLILLDMQTSLGTDSIFLHNPMKKIQLLCDGCVKPITSMPFYKCSQQCGFVLHEWCVKLPLEVQSHPGHPEHTLVHLSNSTHRRFFGLFECSICKLPSNSFVYGCTMCDYYVDINCAFLPTEVTHEAHPDHLLSIKSSSNPSKMICKACHCYIADRIAFHCPFCDFYLHIECAFLLPRIIRHKHDKHPLSLTYNPVENHSGDYFCEICEDEFDPKNWFYHCSICVQSMHSACAPLILKCEEALGDEYKRRVFWYIHVKFGKKFGIQGHPHPVAFVRDIKSHDQCKACYQEMQDEVIFKCLECEYACHYDCATSVDN